MGFAKGLRLLSISIIMKSNSNRWQKNKKEINSLSYNYHKEIGLNNNPKEIRLKNYHKEIRLKQKKK